MHTFWLVLIHDLLEDSRIDYKKDKEKNYFINHVE